MEAYLLRQETNRALIKTISLYMRHIIAVEQVSEEENRTFSNALQTIIDDYTERKQKLQGEAE